MARSLSTTVRTDYQRYDQVYPILLGSEPSFPYAVRPKLYEAYPYLGAHALLNVNDYVLVKFSKENTRNDEFLPFSLLLGGAIANWADNKIAILFSSNPNDGADQFSCEGIQYPIVLNSQPLTEIAPRPLVNNTWTNYHPDLVGATMIDEFNFKFTLTAKNELTGSLTVALTQWKTGEEGTVYTTTIQLVGAEGVYGWIDPTLVIGNPRAFFDPYFDKSSDPIITCVSHCTINSVTFTNL